MTAGPHESRYPDPRRAELIPDALPAQGLAYACRDCDEVFRVDPADPFDAHGKYLDHIAEHDDDQADEADPGECSETCAILDDRVAVLGEV